MKTKISFMAALLCIAALSMPTYASDGDEYITISVDATDDNGNLKYALDSDDPSAFGDSNEFRVQAGTSHTIYVKDVAGNITSQTYDPSGNSTSTNASTGNSTRTETTGEPVEENANERDQQINIELEMGGSSRSNMKETDYSNYDYGLSDGPVSSGTATVSQKVTTDGSDNAEKVFYTFTTKEGETLYLVIDQAQNSDNVYLLDSVSISDLSALASGSGSTSSVEKKEDNLLSALAQENENTEEENSNNTAKSKSNSNLILVLVFVGIAGGAYYYLKIYKNKKDESMDIIDARDMDEFEAEDEEENGDEIDFALDEENERYLDELLDEEEKHLYDIDPEEYAISQMDENEADSDEDQEPDDSDADMYINPEDDEVDF